MPGRVCEREGKKRAPNGSLTCSKSPKMAPMNHASHYSCPCVVPSHIESELAMSYILYCDDGYTTIHICQNSSNCIPKISEFNVSQLYFNKPEFKKKIKKRNKTNEKLHGILFPLSPVSLRIRSFSDEKIRHRCNI